MRRLKKYWKILNAPFCVAIVGFVGILVAAIIGYKAMIRSAEITANNEHGKLDITCLEIHRNLNITSTQNFIDSKN